MDNSGRYALSSLTFELGLVLSHHRWLTVHIAMAQIRLNNAWTDKAIISPCVPFPDRLYLN